MPSKAAAAPIPKLAAAAPIPKLAAAAHHARLVLADPMGMLTHRHFTLALAAAFALHALALAVWALSPKTEVVDIPVRALNIKLGDGDMLTSEEIAQVAPGRRGNTAAVNDTIERLVRGFQPGKAQAEALTRRVDKAVVAAAAGSTPKQYVRAPSEVAKLQSGAPGSSSRRDAELMSRYEQLISSWIQKFKLYPEEVRAEGLQGSTVVRIRIDRRGNVRYWALEHSTGFAQLDRAAIDMIRRANPVPAVPANYPAGELFEYLIPVSFSLKE